MKFLSKKKKKTPYIPHAKHLRGQTYFIKSNRCSLIQLVCISNIVENTSCGKLGGIYSSSVHHQPPPNPHALGCRPRPLLFSFTQETRRADPAVFSSAPSRSHNTNSGGRIGAPAANTSPQRRIYLNVLPPPPPPALEVSCRHCRRAGGALLGLFENPFTPGH